MIPKGVKVGSGNGGEKFLLFLYISINIHRSYRQMVIRILWGREWLGEKKSEKAPLGNNNGEKLINIEMNQ